MLIKTVKPVEPAFKIIEDVSPGIIYAPYIPIYTSSATPIRWGDNICPRSKDYELRTIITKIYQLKLRPSIGYIEDPRALRPKAVRNSGYMAITIKFKSRVIIFCPSKRRMWQCNNGARLKPVAYDAKIAGAVAASFIALITGDDNIDYKSDISSDFASRAIMRRYGTKIIKNSNLYPYQEAIMRSMNVPIKYILTDKTELSPSYNELSAEHIAHIRRLFRVSDKPTYGKGLITKMMDKIWESRNSGTKPPQS